MPNGEPVTVKISNNYACGRQSGGRVDVSPPTDDLDEWWERVVLPETGDGHACGSRERALYEAVIVAAPGEPGLIGQTRSWAG